MKELYRAKMQHSSDTLKRFTVLQYDTFEPLGKLLRLAAAVVLIVIGAFSGSSALLVFLLFVGCVLMTNLNFKAVAVADRVERALGGKFPTLAYSFSDSGFTDGEGREKVAYASLIRLIEDKEYLYLFVSKASGYMIELSSVTGDGGAEGLKRLLSEKSGCKWTSPVTLLTLRLKDFFVHKK